MSFHLQSEFIEALADQQKVELFSNVCGYLEDSGDCLDSFNSAARWDKATVLEYINTHFWRDFSAAAIADIKSGGDRKRLFQFVVLPQCRHLLPEGERQELSAVLGSHRCKRNALLALGINNRQSRVWF